MNISNECNNILTLSNEKAMCQISLFGANLLSYRPKGEKDVFWLGNLNKFDGIQAIRGGIPVCWPRFAEEKLNGRLPRHGFARLSEWGLKKVTVDENKIEAELFLQPDAKFAVNARAGLFIKITDKLEYCLETVNDGDDVFEFSEALHAYFNVSSLENVEIKGLSGCRYENSLDGKIYTLEDNLKINGEFDAAFLEHAGQIEIADKGFGRSISIEKHGSNTTVVWNPNKDLAEMSEGQHKRFVCVEPANQGEAFVRLNPGETHRISMIIGVSHLK